MLELKCKLCNEYIHSADANAHLRAHSVRYYTELEFKISPNNIRDLIRAEMENNFKVLESEILKIEQIPFDFIPKLEVDNFGEGMSYKIISGKYNNL